jgi:SAM-dependent methyltransferase
MGSELLIPARGDLCKTERDDPVDYYYKPVIARLYRSRLEAAMKLLGRGPFQHVLEVGYGSGILLPELSRRSARLAAIDIHPEREAVAASMRRLGVGVELQAASLYELPFETGTFDALVCLSVLEHLEELDEALDELRRVLAPGKIAVLGFPVRNPITDAFFRLLGYSPRKLHPASHVDILRAVGRHLGFRLVREVRVPSLLPRSLSAYVACRCVAT